MSGHGLYVSVICGLGDVRLARPDLAGRCLQNSCAYVCFARERLPARQHVTKRLQVIGDFFTKLLAGLLP